MAEVPETGKGEGTTTFQGDIHGSFAPLLFLPLIETIGNHEAAFRAQQPLEAGLLGQCLCPGVNHLRANRLIFGPRRDQPPLQPIQVNRAIAQNADHLLRWCDIIARCCFYSRCDAKGFGNSFDVNGKCIAATHVFLLIGVITNQYVPYILYYSFLTC